MKSTTAAATIAAGDNNNDEDAVPNSSFSTTTTTTTTTGEETTKTMMAQQNEHGHEQQQQQQQMATTSSTNANTGRLLLSRSQLLEQSKGLEQQQRRTSTSTTKPQGKDLMSQSRGLRLTMGFDFDDIGSAHNSNNHKKQKYSGFEAVSECGTSEYDEETGLKKIKFRLGDPIHDNTKWWGRFRNQTGAIINHQYIQNFVTLLIVLNAILLGALTFLYDNDEATKILEKIDLAFLTSFTIEITMQFTYLGVAKFFVNGWMVFDGSIVLFSWVFLDSQLSIFRAFRIFRLFAMVRRMQSLRRLVKAVGRTMPKMATIAVALLLLFYVFCVLFTSLYHGLYEEGYTDENYFGRMDLTMLTLFQFMTLDSYTAVKRQVMVAHPYSWLGFIVFVIITAFFIINLVVAVICESLLELNSQSDTNLETKILQQQKDAMEIQVQAFHQETQQIHTMQKEMLANQVAMCNTLVEMMKHMRGEMMNPPQVLDNNGNDNNIQEGGGGSNKMSLARMIEEANLLSVTSHHVRTTSSHHRPQDINSIDRGSNAMRRLSVDSGNGSNSSSDDDDDDEDLHDSFCNDSSSLLYGDFIEKEGEQQGGKPTNMQRESIQSPKRRKGKKKINTTTEKQLLLDDESKKKEEATTRRTPENDAKRSDDKDLESLVARTLKTNINWSGSVPSSEQQDKELESIGMTKVDSLGSAPSDKHGKDLESLAGSNSPLIIPEKLRYREYENSNLIKETQNYISTDSTISSPKKERIRPQGPTKLDLIRMDPKKLDLIRESSQESRCERSIWNPSLEEMESQVPETPVDSTGGAQNREDAFVEFPTRNPNFDIESGGDYKQC